MSQEPNHTLKETGGFRIRYVFAGLALLLFLLAMVSYTKSDLAVLDGGSTEPIRNWIGPLGANISKSLFFLFGLAAYPVSLLLIVCLVRSFMPYPLKRRGYLLSLLAVIFGTVVLMALFPAEFAVTTDKLGLGHAGMPELALSGGAFGSLLAAPETQNFPAGLIRRWIGTAGTAISAAVFLIAGLFFIFLSDWKCFFVKMQEAKPLFKPNLADKEVVAPPRKKLLELFKRKGEKEEVTEAEPDVPAVPAPATEPEQRELPVIPEESQEEIPVKKVKEEDEVQERIDAEVEEELKKEFPEPVPAEEPETKTPQPPVAVANPVSDPFNAPKNTNSRRSIYPEDKPFDLPSAALLDRPKSIQTEDTQHLDMARATLQSTLDSFGIDGTVCETIVGPRITRFEIMLEPAVKVEKVSGIQNNIAKDMLAESIRVLAPVPGKGTVGIEVPNKVSNMVFIRELVEADAWKNSHADIPIILGKDVEGKVIVTDLAKAPHLLIAGSTGSGKSVCMNTLIMSLLYKFSPYALRLILVDPKYVELEMYRPLPHLITPVVNDPKKVPFALRWGVNEMEHRYQMLAKVKAKNLNAFNSRPPDPEPVLDERGDVIPQKLPLLIIIVDELADIMMTEAKKDVETSICRIAQKGRAAGIHLVIATQTPRKDIITGTIKANLPTKISFKVSTNMDSRVILDGPGAEKLLGKGDMLFKGPSGETERIQGSMVSDAEIQKVVDFVSNQAEQHFDTTVVLDPEEEEDPDKTNSFEDIDTDAPDGGAEDYVRMVAKKYLQPGDDENIRTALEIILRENKASTSYLQRRMGIGYNRAAEIIDRLEERGIVSAPLPGGQKRDILVFDALGKPEE